MQKLSRKEAFSINPVLSNHLMILQDDKYNPAHHPVEEGDEVFLEEENMSVSLSKEDAEQINADDLEFYQATKDNYPIDSSITWIGGDKFIPTSKKAEPYLKDLVHAFTSMAEQHPDQSLYVLGDWPTPWLADKGDAPAMLEAYKYFKSHCKPNFNGGFKVAVEEFDTFIPHLFWLTRGSSILPDFLMAFEKGRTAFSICRYGVIHLESYDSVEMKSLKAIFESRDFKAVQECEDYISF